MSMLYSVIIGKGCVIPMIKHLLFDLDGTLLPVDLDFFFRHYIQALSRSFSHLMPEKQFSQHLLASTTRMITDRDPTRTNEEVFWADFCDRINRPRSELEPVFLHFYRHEFPGLKKFINHPEPVREILEDARQKNFSLILATNAIFPEFVIRERLSWINCHDLHFSLITSFEQMHFCKPNPEYYREILNALKIPAGSCMMIGNDAEEDLVASVLGIKTCLVTDYLIPRDNNLQPDFSCRLAELPSILEKIKKESS